MTKKTLISALAGILFSAAFGTLNAQWQTSGNNVLFDNTGKVLIKSNSSDWGQMQILNPSGSEASIQFISIGTNFGIPPQSNSGDSHLWIIGSSIWNNGGNVFGIGNKGYGNQTGNGQMLGITSDGRVGIGTTNPIATLDVLGSNGSVNDRNFRVLFKNGQNLTNTEFSALTYTTLAGGNNWTALYAKQGSASKAGVFEGDVRVTGTLKANEIMVTSGGADFVFESDYRLRPLAEVEEFITTNKHLPDIAPAAEMIENGVNMGEFQIQLLQKIEELTLYVIELKKEIEELKNDNQ